MIHLALYQPEIPQNTGNIIRTAASFKAKVHLIRPLGFQMDDVSLKRAGMDYMDLSEIYFHDSLEDFLFEVDDKTLYILTRYGKRPLDEIEASDVTKDIYFLFGRESSGLPRDFLISHSNQLIRIPMRPEARSLNLSNTVAIVAYEAIRQQHFFSLSSQEEIKGADFIRGRKK